jgi:hypothetical protein
MADYVPFSVERTGPNRARDIIEQRPVDVGNGRTTTFHVTPIRTRQVSDGLHDHVGAATILQNRDGTQVSFYAEDDFASAGAVLRTPSEQLNHTRCQNASLHFSAYSCDNFICSEGIARTFEAHAMGNYESQLLPLEEPHEVTCRQPYFPSEYFQADFNSDGLEDVLIIFRDNGQVVGGMVLYQNSPIPPIINP